MIHARADYNRIQDPSKKIAVDEPVFLLRAKDKIMPEVTAYWAQRLREEGGDERMVELVNNHVVLAKEWQLKNGCKLPDLPTDIDAHRRFRLNGDVDCSAIAKEFGGGGHKGAAGFKIKNIESFIIANKIN